MKPSRSEFVVVRGRRLHVRRWGAPEAPAIFLLHGWCDVSASFQFVVDALKQEWNVIAPDWRGFGLSQANDESYWFPDYLADLAFLLDHYHADGPARLVGHSMGGNVASLFAGILPERVAGIVNLEGFGLKPVSPERAPERYAKWVAQIGDTGGFRVYPDLSAFAARLRRDNPRLTAARADFLAPHLSRSVEQGVVLAADPCHRWVNPVLYRIEEAMACWRRATAPVLWMYGANSEFLKAEHIDAALIAERLACFAHGRVIAIDDCGHNLHHDQPERVAGAIEEFFA